MKGMITNTVGDQGEKKMSAKKPVEDEVRDLGMCNNPQMKSSLICHAQCLHW